MILYHSTPAHRAADIERYGLRAGTHLSEVPLPELVAMLHDTDDVVTFQVDTGDLWLHPGDDGPYTWRSHGQLLPDRLKRLP